MIDPDLINVGHTNAGMTIVVSKTALRHDWESRAGRDGAGSLGLAFMIRGGNRRMCSGYSRKE